MEMRLSPTAVRIESIAVSMLLLVYAVVISKFSFDRMLAWIGKDREDTEDERPSNSSDVRTSMMTSTSDRVAEQAQASAKQLRIDNIKLLLKLGMHLNAAYLLVVQLLSTQVWSGSFTGTAFANDDVIFGALLLAVGLVVYMVPSCLTPTFINCLYASLMVLMIAKTITSESVYLLVFRAQTATFLRMGLALVCGSVRATTVMNWLFSVASIWAYLDYARGDQNVQEIFISGHEQFYIFNEIMTTIIISMVCYGLESRGLAMSRAIVKERISSQAAGTVNMLLTALCDAVVHLDQNFDILIGLEKLQTLLLKRPGRHSSFLDALVESDRSRFLTACSASQSFEGSNIAPALHVGMPDANGTIVNVQLYITRFPNVGNCYEYILGVRELSREEDDSAFVYGYNDTGTGSFENPLSPRSPRTPKERSESSGGSDTSSQMGFGSFPVVPLDEELGGMIFYFDAMTGLIRQATVGFSEIGGPSTVGGDIWKWVKGGHFRSDVQELVNHVMQGSEPDSSLDYGWLILQPPVAKRAQIEYKAKCQLDVIVFGSTDDEEFSDEEVYLVRAVLTKVSQRQRSKGHRRPLPNTGDSKTNSTSLCTKESL